jgi:CRP-like cAMP-binding protein
MGTEAKPCSAEQIDAWQDILLDFPLFHLIDPDELQVLGHYLQYRDLDPDQFLFNEWDKSDFVALVIQGSLDVLKKSGPKTYAPLTTIRKGQSIGEMSMIEDFPRSATVKASTPAIVLLLPRAGFQALMAEHIQIGIKLLKGIAHHLSENLRKTASRLADYMLPLS